MPGRPDFSQPGSRGSGQTVAMQSRPELEQLQIDPTTTIPAGETIRTEIYAPTGATYSVESLYAHAQSIGSATTGNHVLWFEGMGALGIIKGQSQYNSPVYWVYSGWRTADIEQAPSDPAAQIHAVQSLKATENTSFAIKYGNNTDAEQTNPPGYTLIIEEVSY